MRKLFRAQYIPFLVFAAGLINILSSLWANGPVRIALLEAYVPLRISNLSRTFTVAIGIALVLLSWGLLQRKRRALILSLIFFVPVLFAHLIKGLDVEEVIVNLVVMILLVKNRRYFSVLSQPLTFRSVFRSIAFAVAALGIYVYAGMFALRGEFRGTVNVGSISREYVYLTTGYRHEVLQPQTRRARWFYESIMFIHTLALILIFPALFAPFADQQLSSEKDRQDALSLIHRKSVNSISPMAGMPDKKYFFGSDRTCCVAYRTQGKFAVALGEPIGYEEDIRDVAEAFGKYCFSCGLKPVWYSVSAEGLSHFPHQKSFRIGDEAVIDLKSFDLTKPAMKNVRNAKTKLDKEGVSFSWFSCDSVPWKDLKEMEILHDSWLKAKKLSPMTFSMEYFPLPTDQEGYVLVGRYHDKVACALSFYPYRRGNSYVLDLMLRSTDSPNGIMETAIAEAASHFHALGAAELNLSLAPLVISGESHSKADELRNEFLSRFSRWYKFRPLQAFKNKFSPIWRPKYLVYQNSADLPGATLALLRVHFRKVE